MKSPRPDASANHKRPLRRGARFVLPLVGLAVFASGCVDAKQDSLKPAGRYADIIFDLVTPVFAVAGVVMVIVLGGTLYFALRYRVPADKPLEGEELPEPVHGSFWVEITWTVIPALILAVIGALTVIAVFRLAEEPKTKSPRVEVIGQQWWWEFRYDLNNDNKYDEIVTANELVIPAGVDVALRMDSRDVIHGFWVPQLNGKRDTNPGHPTKFNIQASEPGVYYGQCTVMCGLSHANMRFEVHALSKADFAKWQAQQQKPAVSATEGLAKDGQGLFVSQCGECHNVRGIHKVDPKKIPLTSGAAPDLTHFMSRTTFAGAEFKLRRDTKECVAKGWNFADDPDCIDEANLRAWLHDPEAMLPMYAQGLKDKEGNTIPGTVRGMPTMNLAPAAIDQLVAFLTTLK